jgi:hypothetical protein
VSAVPAHRHPPTRRAAPGRPARRVSGPARPQQRDRRIQPGGSVALPRPRPQVPAAPSLAPRLVDGLRALPDHRLLERLLRGRAWIALIALALGGIVAMQVSLLKVNSGIGRAVETSATLERQNAELRAAVSQLSSEERIQREALAMGLQMPLAGDVRYLTARGGGEDAQKAARIMRAPDAAAAAAAAAASAAATATPATEAATTTPPVDPAATAAPPAAAADPAAAATPTSDPAVVPQAAAAPAAPTAPAAQRAPEPQPAAASSGAAVAPVAGGTP